MVPQVISISEPDNVEAPLPSREREAAAGVGAGLKSRRSRGFLPFMLCAQ